MSSIWSAIPQVLKFHTDDVAWHSLLIVKLDARRFNDARDRLLRYSGRVDEVLADVIEWFKFPECSLMPPFWFPSISFKIAVVTLPLGISISVSLFTQLGPFESLQR